MDLADGQLPPETARILSAQRQATILSGAGISIDEPAAVPNAMSIIRAAIESICDTAVRKALKRGGTNLSLLQTSPPRFEAFLEVVRESLDGSLGVLHSIGEVGSTNTNHHACAHLIHSGAYHITLNFDTLIEQAADRSGIPIHRLVTDREFQTWNGTPALAKLHGSIDVPHTIRATLDTVGKGVDGFVFDPVRRHFLQESLLNKPLIVVGYSASDDFDVTPFLLTNPSRRAIVWIQHSTASPRVVPLRATRWIPKQTIKLLKALKVGPRRHAQVHLILGNTSKVLNWLASQAGCQPRAFSGTQHPPIAKVIKSWLSHLKPSPAQRRFMIAEILNDRQPRAASHMYATTLTPQGKSTAKTTDVTSQALFRLSTLAGNNGDYQRAQRLLTQAYEQSHHSSPDHRANCLLCLGNLAFDQGDNRTALARYHQAIAAFRKTESSLGVHQAQFQIGRILLNQGRIKRAKECFTQVKRHLEKAGHMISLAVSLNLLAAAETLQGHYEHAKTHIEASMRITSNLEGAQRTYAAALRGRAFLYMLYTKHSPEYHPRNDAQRAKTIYGRARDQLGVAACHYLIARIQERSRPDTAARHYRTVAHMAKKLGANRAIAVSQLGLARCLTNKRVTMNHYNAARTTLLQQGCTRELLPAASPTTPSVIETFF